MPADDAHRAEWVRGVARETGATPARVDQLLARYGTTARAIAAAEGAGPVWVAATEAVSEAEVAWIARHESVHHLEDIVLRRTQLAITGQLTGDNLAQICAVAGAALDWNAERTQTELDQARDVLKRRHGVAL